MSGRALLESRVIRVYLIAVAAILAASFLSHGVAIWITQRAVELARSDIEVPEVLNTLAAGIGVGAAAGVSLATITTALIARYGAREAMRNLGSNSRVDGADTH